MREPMCASVCVTQAGVAAVKQAAVKQAAVKQAVVKQAVVKQAAVKQAVVKQAVVKQAGQRLHLHPPRGRELQPRLFKPVAVRLQDLRPE